MLRTIIGGIAVGIANIIPGVSGGTMMVILGIFNQVTESISGLFKPHNPDRKKHFLFLVTLAIGAVIGLVGFAKVLTYLFENFPTQTMYWFIGMVAFSIPMFMKSELKDRRLNVIAAILGAAAIFAINFLNPGNGTENVKVTLPALSAMLCIKMIFIGMIGGATMLLPGVSGSMILMIIGQYHLFRTYLATLTDGLTLTILVPLGFMGIGIALGVVLASVFIKWALNKNASFTASFLLGLIIASSIVLIPLHADYTNISLVITSVIALVFGGMMVIGIDKLS